MISVIIAGSRGFENYELLCRVCDSVLSMIISKRIEIVSGTAKGADKLGERYAQDRGYTLKQFPANWDRYGKAAGYKRNEQMANNADILIAFWDGKSRGTLHMINLAKEHGLKVKVVMYYDSTGKSRIFY